MLPQHIIIQPCVGPLRQCRRRAAANADRLCRGGIIMRKRPLIAVAPRYECGTDKLWLRERCMRFLSAVGLMPVMTLPPDTAEQASELLSLVSGVMLVGGGDVRPFRYGEEDDGLGRGICDARDWSELLLAHGAIRNDIPLLGICRGAQVMAVALGGKLRRDVPAHDSREHRVYVSPYSLMRTGLPDDSEVYNNVDSSESDRISACIIDNKSENDGISRTLDITSEFFACGDRVPPELSDPDGMIVNSYHRQSISDPGDGAVTAMAEDGVAEMIELSGHPFCLGVQWHPEIDRTDPVSLRIARLFAESAYRCRKRSLGF